MLTPLAVSYANSNIPVSTLGSCADLRESFDGVGFFLSHLLRLWRNQPRLGNEPKKDTQKCSSSYFVPPTPPHPSLWNISWFNDNICFHHQHLCSDKVVPCEVDWRGCPVVWSRTFNHYDRMVKYCHNHSKAIGLALMAELTWLLSLSRSWTILQKT